MARAFPSAAQTHDAPWLLLRLASVRLRGHLGDAAVVLIWAYDFS